MYFFLVIIISTLFLTIFGWLTGSKGLNKKYKNDRNLVENLKKHVYKLSHEIGERSYRKYGKLVETEEYIAKQFNSYGYKNEFQEYSINNQVFRNIIAAKQGKEKKKEIIVGAHYDTVVTPGADDNASAIAGLLELSKYFSEIRTSKTLRFIAFVNEEPPFFKTEKMGSRLYTMAAKQRADDIQIAFILEMIGYYSDKPFSQKYPPFLGPFYPNTGNYIAVIGNLHSKGIVDRIVKAFKENSSFPIESLNAPSAVPGIDFSDNWSFWQEGYPAVMITDTAFYRNYNYHRLTDTYEKLDYISLAEVINGLKYVLKWFSDHE